MVRSQKNLRVSMLLTHIVTAECHVKSVPYCGSSLVKLSCHQNFLCFCRPLQRRNTPDLTSLLKLQDMPFDWLSASSFLQGHPVKLNVPYFRPCQFHKFSSSLMHQSQIKMVKYSLFKHIFSLKFSQCADHVYLVISTRKTIFLNYSPEMPLCHGKNQKNYIIIC